MSRDELTKHLDRFRGLGESHPPKVDKVTGEINSSQYVATGTEGDAAALIHTAIVDEIPDPVLLMASATNGSEGRTVTGGSRGYDPEPTARRAATKKKAFIQTIRPVSPNSTTKNRQRAPQ
jgi:hypothetical protein